MLVAWLPRGEDSGTQCQSATCSSGPEVRFDLGPPDGPPTVSKFEASPASDFEVSLASCCRAKTSRVELRGFPTPAIGSSFGFPISDQGSRRFLLATLLVDPMSHNPTALAPCLLPPLSS